MTDGPDAQPVRGATPPTTASAEGFAALVDQAMAEVDRESADRDAEQIGRSNVNIALIIVVLALALLMLLLLFQLRKVAKEPPTN
jgi:hypothetical protein